MLTDENLLPDAPTHDPARPIPQSLTPPRPAAGLFTDPVSPMLQQDQRPYADRTAGPDVRNSTPVKEKKPHLTPLFS